MQSNLPTRFRWKRLETSEANAAKKMLLEISGDQSQVIPLTGLEDSLEHPLRSGLYRWRIVSNDSFGLKPESSWNHFSVQELLPPVIIGPVDAYTATLSDGKNQVTIPLQWHKTSAQLKVEVEIGEFGKETDSKISEASLSGFSAALSEGSYFWRVRAVDFQGRPSSWSESRRITIQKSEMPVAQSQLVEGGTTSQEAAPVPAAEQTAPAVAVVPDPTPVEAKPVEKPVKALGYDFKAQDISVTTTLKSSNTYQIPILFQWEEVSAAQGYTVTVYDPKGKKVIELKSKTNKLDYSVETLDQDNSSYIVTAQTGTGKDSVSSKAKIHVLISAPKPKLPDEGKSFAMGASVLLTWEKIVLASGYRIQIAERKDFKSTVSDSERTGNIFTFAADKPGRYYWRVRGNASKHLSEWSKPRSFLVK
jgi:hypothetical protein